MTVFQSLAFLLSLAALWSLFQTQSVCVRCGGRGGHRRDCPLDEHSKKDESDS
jgi:hypothetical protein